MQRPKPLSRLLVDPSRDEHVVAFRRSGELLGSDLRTDVAALAARLRAAASGRFLLISEDSYAAAVGLLALARTGGVAVLPPPIPSRRRSSTGRRRSSSSGRRARRVTRGPS